MARRRLSSILVPKMTPEQEAKQLLRKLNPRALAARHYDYEDISIITKALEKRERLGRGGLPDMGAMAAYKDGRNEGLKKAMEIVEKNYRQDKGELISDERLSAIIITVDAIAKAIGKEIK